MRDEGWTAIRLGDACVKISSGATPRGGSNVYLDAGEIALIRSQNVHNEGFQADGLAYISQEHADQLRNAEVQPGDVLLNITGDSVARCCQVDPTVLPARVNQHVAIIRPNPSLLDARFLRYFLVSPQMQATMLSWAGAGGTRDALTKGMVESFQVIAPRDINKQHAIACVLGALDDKIELNRRMNQTIEAMGQAIFKSWFVDCDPVRAKTLGRDHGLPPSIAELFPDSCEDSELGKIPAGWSVQRLSTVARPERQMTNPALAPEKVWEHYSIPAFDAGQQPVLQLGSAIKSGKLRVPPGSVLVSKLNPQFPRVWLVDVQDEQAAICSTEFIPFVPAQKHGRAFLYELMKSSVVQQGIRERVTGSTGSRQRAKSEEIVHMQIVVPENRLIDAFYKLVDPMHRSLLASVRQSSTLAAIRDSLLPKLMSGELRIPDAERIVGRCV